MRVFVSTGNSVLTARTGHYTPLPFGCSPLTRPLEVRALLQPPVSQTALREIPMMPWGRMCFAAVFMVPFGFSKLILVRPLYLVRSDSTAAVFRPTCCMAFWTWTSLWILPVMRPYRDDISGYWSTGIRALNSHPDLKPEETDQQKPIDRIRLLLLILASSCHIYCHVVFLCPR